MTSHSLELTPDDLSLRIFRWNLEQCAWGGVILACSALLCVPTFYGTLVFVTVLRTLPSPEWTTSWNEQDGISHGLTVMILVFLTWLGCSKWSTLFVSEHADSNGIELPEWKLNDRLGTELLVAIPGIAPALALHGFRMFGRCFSRNRRRIKLACRTYAYLKEQDTWVPYPDFLSQRQAVILLYHLGLIHFSNRFGKQEIRVRGSSSVPW